MYFTTWLVLERERLQISISQILPGCHGDLLRAACLLMPLKYSRTSAAPAGQVAAVLREPFQIKALSQRDFEELPPPNNKPLLPTRLRDSTIFSSYCDLSLSWAASYIFDCSDLTVLLNIHPENTEILKLFDLKTTRKAPGRPGSPRLHTTRRRLVLVGLKLDLVTRSTFHSWLFNLRHPINLPPPLY